MQDSIMHALSSKKHLCKQLSDDNPGYVQYANNKMSRFNSTNIEVFEIKVDIFRFDEDTVMTRGCTEVVCPPDHDSSLLIGPKHLVR